MTKAQMKANLKEQYAILMEDEQITQINTMEKPEYSPLDMRDDEINFNELAYLCSKPSVGFKGRQAYLSLGYTSPIEIKGHWFLTAGHALLFYRCKYACDAVKYEAGKPNSINDYRDAVKASRKDIIRANWSQIAEAYCYAIIEQKFRQNEELAAKLIREDGIFNCSEAEGGEPMSLALSRLMSNLKAEDERYMRETLRHKFF